MNPGTPTGTPTGSSLAPTQEERTWGMLSHLGMIIVIGPLLVYLTKGKESEFVGDQSREALNFQITLFIINIGLSIVGGILGRIAGPIAMLFSCVSGLVGLAGLVLLIMGAIKANGGERYRYPFNFRLIKG